MIQINLDPNVIQKSLDEQAQKATEAAFKSYAVESAIKDRLTNALIGEALTKATTQAIDKIDIESLSQALADQISKTTVAAVSKMITDSTVSTIAKLRGYESYQDDYDAKMNALRCEIEAHANTVKKQ